MLLPLVRLLLFSLQLIMEALAVMFGQLVCHSDCRFDVQSVFLAATAALCVLMSVSLLVRPSIS